MNLGDSQRPFKITDYKREKKVGIVAESLEDLKLKAQDKFSSKLSVKVVLEVDGTEIDEEEYFNTLEYNTTLMVLFEDEKWLPMRRVCDAVDGGEHPLTELLFTLQQDIGQVSLLGGKELELLSDMDPDNVLDIIPDKVFLKQVKEASGRFLSDKRQAQEALDLLKLYHKSCVSNGHDSDVKKSRTDH